MCLCGHNPEQNFCDFCVSKQILAKLVIIFLLFVAGSVNEFGASLVADWVQLVDVHRLIE